MEAIWVCITANCSIACLHAEKEAVQNIPTKEHYRKHFLQSLRNLVTCK